MQDTGTHPPSKYQALSLDALEFTRTEYVIDEVPEAYYMPSTNICPERRLWQAKIVQYLQDSLANHPKRYAPKIRSEAREFFNHKNQDFIDTCDYAGWPPHLALAMFTKVQQSGTVPRLVKQFCGMDEKGDIVVNTKQNNNVVKY